MSKLKSKQSDTLGSIAAVQTLLERYPTLTTTDSMLTNFSINTSVGFLLDILSLLGVTQTDLVNWLTKFLTDKGNDSLLPIIENAIKAILLANVKDLWTCSVDPILPDSLMKYTYPYFSDDPNTARRDPCTIPVPPEKYKEITIDLNQVDMFGILNNCPSDSDGSIFYFDSYESIFNTENRDISKLPNFKGSFKSLKELNEHFSGVTPENIETTDIYKTTDGVDKYYTWDGLTWKRYNLSAQNGPNDLWKSCDFNAYLWYIINKSTISNLSDIQRATWDDRVRHIEQLNDETKRNEFFNINKCMSTGVSGDSKIKIDDDLYKRQLIICEYVERNTPSTNEGSLPSSNILKVWLNANRYYKTNKIKNKNGFELALNKTIFEFNYDYIYSLKLFDTKTLVASIVNSLLGLGSSASISFSVQEKMIEGKVSEMINKIIEEDDQSNPSSNGTSNNGYHTFSNNQYNSLLNDAMNKYNGVYLTGNSGAYGKVNTQDILDSIKILSTSNDPLCQANNLKRVLEEITNSVSSAPTISTECQFNFGLNFIKDFIKQTVTQIVLQVLTPKVAILYYINEIIMGGKVDDMHSWENFIKNFQNILVAIIKQVKNIIVEELYKFVMEQLKPLLELMIAKIALETIQYYKDLIEQLLRECIPNIPMIKFGGSGNHAIDNVNYADIASELTQPNN